MPESVSASLIDGWATQPAVALYTVTKGLWEHCTCLYTFIGPLPPINDLSTRNKGHWRSSTRCSTRGFSYQIRAKFSLLPPPLSEIIFWVGDFFFSNHSKLRQRWREKENFFFILFILECNKRWWIISIIGEKSNYFFSIIFSRLERL